MNDIQLQMCILLSIEHLDELQRKHLELGQQLRTIVGPALADELLGRRKPPEAGRFRLQVDRQTKASYVTREAAEQAGLAIKRGFPIVHVTVFDADAGQSETIVLLAA
jgi:hypothetical protein